jgi:hypothetical protein
MRIPIALFVVLCSLIALATPVAAQPGTSPGAPATPTAPTLPSPPVPGTAGAGSPGSMIAVAVLVFALLVIVGVAVKAYDFKRKREAEAVHLQAQISDALLRDERLFGLPVTPTAHVPFWSGSPATVEVSGEVPSSDVERAALAIVEQEAKRLRPDVTVVDRMSAHDVAKAA